MNARRIAIAAAAVAVLGVVGYGFYSLGMSSGMKMAAPAAEPAAGRKVLYWYDPMRPEAHFDQPGKSPFMDMELVPRYADGDAAAQDAGAAGVRIDPQLRQSLGMRTVAVTRGRIEAPLEVVGSVAWNERDVAVVQARANGYVEKLYVRAPLDRVRAGEPLADLYVPDWIGAQEEYLAVLRMGEGAPAGLADAARQRMRLAGMSEAQVGLVARERRTHPRLTVAAPIGGVVAELAVREGTTVMNGAPLFRINGLGTVWVNAEVPEAMAAQVRPGARVQVRTEAFPGEVFAGRVGAILPEVNPATRTLKARIEVANREAKLVPGMFTRVALGEGAREATLVVPSEAVIRTGKRDVVMVARGGGSFAPVDVRIGREGGGLTEILQGLSEGEQVVASGQFLVDSEANLQGLEQRLAPATPPQPATPPPAASHDHGGHS